MERVKIYKMNYTWILLIVMISGSMFGQNDDPRVFKDTRIINSVSIETLAKRKLDFRVGHKFGDLSGDAGGWPTFYGLENASDVMIGFDYGLSDKLMIGISRTKGSGELKQNVNFSTKFKLADDRSGSSFPFTLTVYGLASLSTMPKSTSSEPSLSSFELQAHRLVYHMQIMAGKKIANRLSIQTNVGFTYRNVVREGDKNDLVSIGAALKYQINKSFAVIGEGIFPFNGARDLQVESDPLYFPSTGMAFEWETGGGHTFQLNLTNARGLMATDYIPNNTANWSDGEFRMGFVISRLFSL